MWGLEPLSPNIGVELYTHGGLSELEGLLEIGLGSPISQMGVCAHLDQGHTARVWGAGI